MELRIEVEEKVKVRIGDNKIKMTGSEARELYYALKNALNMDNTWPNYYTTTTPSFYGNCTSGYASVETEAYLPIQF